MTYVTASGRQFVVVAAGGHRELHVRAGDFDKAGEKRVVDSFVERL